MLSAVTGKPKQPVLGSWYTNPGRTTLRLFHGNVCSSIAVNLDSRASTYLLPTLLETHFHHPFHESRDQLGRLLVPFGNISVMKDDKKQWNSPLLWEKLVPGPEGKHSLTGLWCKCLCSEKEVNKQRLLPG